MPRLSNLLIRRARHINSLLPLLLRTCRDLSSACNELRWLREHVLNPTKASPARRTWHEQLHHLCVERSRGKPLQYILGNQPFGGLDIICRPGVLVPRSVCKAPRLKSVANNPPSPETEACTTHLATTICGNIAQNFLPDVSPLCLRLPRLRILDLCTGTGCISLLLHAILSSRISHLGLHGIDISSNAIALANRNLRWNIGQTHLAQVATKQVRFSQGNIFHDIPALREHWDIIVSNPPYVSPQGFTRETARSVRKFEPKTALVPPDPSAISDVSGNAPDRDIAIGDAFYPRLLEIAKNVGAKVLLAEVADMEQATRVATLASKGGHWDACEIWRDWPDQGMPSSQDKLKIEGKKVKVVGEGNGRSVFLSRAGGIEKSEPID